MQDKIKIIANFFKIFTKKYPAPEGTGLHQSYSCGIILLTVGTQTVYECQQVTKGVTVFVTDF